MHYATIVAVDVEKELYDDTEPDIIPKIFSCALAEQVSILMEPYYNDTDIMEYLEFEDRTEELKKDYKEGSVNLITLPNGTVITDDSFEFMRKYELVDGKVYQKRWGQLHDRKQTKKCRKMKVRQNVPFTDIYPTISEFVEDQNSWMVYLEEKDAYGFYYNPNAFYDWYSIGGRWPDMFLVKDDCLEYGIPGWSIYEGRIKTEAPEGYRWTCAARKKDIEWQVMFEWKVKKSEEKYEEFKEPFESKEEYRKRTLCVSSKYPINIYAFLWEGEWIQTENFVYDQENSRFEKNETWFEDMERFFDGLEDDTVLVSVDCHM